MRARWPALVVALSVVAAACGGDDSGSAEDAEAALSPEAPAFSAVTLNGDSVSLADLRGSPVLLNVWATWCAPCRQEIPELQTIHETFGPEGLRVVGVTVDSRSAARDVATFVEDFGMTYDVWWDPDQTVVSRFGAIGVPLTVLIDGGGTIRWRHMGVLQPEDPDLREAIRSVL